MNRTIARAVVIVLVAALAACAPKPTLVPYAGAVEKVRPVFVATSRGPETGNPPSYGGLRADHIKFAEYDISIPPTHMPGDLTLPTGEPDPARDFLTVGYRGHQSEAEFIAAVNRALDPLPPQDRLVVMFVHGYYTGFATSVLRAAQVAEDYRLKGPMVMFSWPSAEKLTHYVYDRDSVLFARDQFVETLQALAKTRARSVVILAHSMGSFLTMEGLSRLADRGDRATLARVGAVVLAEPDIDMDVFRTQVRGLDLGRLALVVAASERDRVLKLSNFIAGGHPRVGERRNLETLRRMGVIVVDVSGFADGTLGGHSAFQRSPELVDLIASGELARALTTASGEDNIIVGTLSAVGTVAVAVAYLPYELVQ